MADLTTLANAKAWLPNHSGAGDDAMLTRLISAASEYIQTWLSRTFAISQYTETRNGHGGARMMFADYPVTAVSSVVVDGVSIPAASGPLGSGYIFSSNQIALIGGYTFTRGLFNVSLSYSAGFPVVPNEIEQACIELVALRYKGRDRIGVVSKGLAGEMVSYTQTDFTDAINTILKNYKKVIPL